MVLIYQDKTKQKENNKYLWVCGRIRSLKHSCQEWKMGAATRESMEVSQKVKHGVMIWTIISTSEYKNKRI